jgi:hypothetical protein
MKVACFTAVASFKKVACATEVGCCRRRDCSLGDADNAAINRAECGSISQVNTYSPCHNTPLVRQLTTSLRHTSATSPRPLPQLDDVVRFDTSHRQSLSLPKHHCPCIHSHNVEGGISEKSVEVGVFLSTTSWETREMCVCRTATSPDLRLSCAFKIWISTF